jgi:hypothetical protein
MSARRLIAIGTLVLIAFVIQLRASGQAGVYGVIDKVIQEPASGPAERAQVWGTFALMETSGTNFTGYIYKRPVRGYLYFRLPNHPTDVENARREWKDLASQAGTKQALAFGYWDRNTGDKMMTVRDASTKPAEPDVYYMNVGVQKLRNPGSGVIDELIKLASSR